MGAAGFVYVRRGEVGGSREVVRDNAGLEGEDDRGEAFKLAELRRDCKS